MDSILELIQRHGALVYAILFAYTALKSGWLPLFAGYAAFAGALNVWAVALVCLAGGYLGDELRFHVARKYGVRWIHNKGRLQALFIHASELASRYGLRYIFFYRYPKGLRTIGALPIGLTSMPWSVFTLMNASSAVIWVTLLVGGGFTYGATFEAIGMQNLTALSLLLLGIFLISLYRVWRLSITSKQPCINQPQDQTNE